MASRYWIGGSGDWSDTAHWSTTSGGAGGASKPTSSDDVYFDSNSGLSGATITLDESAICNDFTSTAGISYTFAGDFGIEIFGSVILENGITFSGDAGIITFSSADSGNTITTNGAIATNFTFQGVGSWVLQDNLILAGYLYFLNGTFDANDFDITLTGQQGVFSLSDSPTLNMGSGTWQGLAWVIDGDVAITINPESSTIKILITEQSENVFLGGGKTYNNLWIDGDGFIASVKGANTFNNLQITSGTTVNFSGGITQTFQSFTAIGEPGNLITLDSDGTGEIVNYSILEAGSGFNVNDVLTGYSGDENATFIVTSVGVGGSITGLNLLSGGSGYSNGEEVYVWLDGGTGDNAYITVDSINILQFTLSKPSGTVSCDYLNISNSNATGGATWYAGANSLDTTNNDGWIFSAPVSGRLKYWNGSSWQLKPLKYWNGISWVEKTLKYFDGSTWS